MLPRKKRRSNNGIMEKEGRKEKKRMVGGADGREGARVIRRGVYVGE